MVEPGAAKPSADSAFALAAKRATGALKIQLQSYGPSARTLWPRFGKVRGASIRVFKRRLRRAGVCARSDGCRNPEIAAPGYVIFRNCNHKLSLVACRQRRMACAGKGVTREMDSYVARCRPSASKQYLSADESDYKFGPVARASGADNRDDGLGRPARPRTRSSWGWRATTRSPASTPTTRSQAMPATTC